MRLAILASHPIQYQAPWFRALAKAVDLQVFFAHRQTAADQGAAGFGVAFDWDVDLLSGYSHRFLDNRSSRPNVNQFSGCDTPEIRGIIRNGRFDGLVLCGWYLKSYLQAALACRAARVPVLVWGDSQLRTPRSALKRLIKTITHRWVLRQFDGFLYVGERNREYLLHYGAPEKRLFFTPHFVDNEWFAERASAALHVRSRLRADLGAGSDEMMVLFVGKFIALKRIEDLVLAVGCDEALRRRTLVVLVGTGPLHNPVEAQVSRCRVRATFVGFKNQSELPAIYAAADVVVLPSGSETWGLVVNEAMACGVPAIVSDAVGCAPDLIRDGDTGFVFPAGDTAALANRLNRLAAMKSAGHDFRAAVLERIRHYSVEAAVEGTVKAVHALARR